jgi:DNA-binding transcriptional regulator YhcF (GntR family)
MPADAHAHVVLDAGSLELRRRLGPTAWMVFEELLCSSAATDHERHASVPIRALAVRLGLAKDTVARAINRLKRAGLVTATRPRTSTGMFTAATYTMTIPDSIIVTNATRSSLSISRSRDTNLVTSQLSLTIEP